jgi:hypothetical protein
MGTGLGGQLVDWEGILSRHFASGSICLLVPLSFGCESCFDLSALTGSEDLGFHNYKYFYPHLYILIIDILYLVHVYTLLLFFLVRCSLSFRDSCLALGEGGLIDSIT